MTFTEAAVEVLRRAGKPLHFKDIAELAVRDNLLSHVGQDPEVTMGQRLSAMAKREEDRKVVAIAPDGTFALIEWGVPVEVIIDVPVVPLQPPETGEPLYRPREREPRAINAQARRRLQELQAEHEPDSVLAQEAEQRAQEERDRKLRKQQHGRRFPPPAEVVFEWLAQRQAGCSLPELSTALLEKGLLSEALVRDLPSLTAALLEDNRRRTEAGRKPAFIVDGERITLVEFPPPPAVGEALSSLERAPQTSLGRPPTGAQLLAETRRAVVRALRRRVGELDTAAFEHLCAALLEKMGMRDVRVAKRGKEGPLYLARQRRGVSDLRVAVRLVRGQREIGRSDVQELRKDLAHYSAQMGLVLAPGEAGREARAEASAAAQPPVALYAGDALAEEMVALRVGVSVQVVELVDVDEAFFLSAVRAAPHRDEQKRDELKRDERPRREREHRAEDGEQAAHAPEAAAEPGAAATEPAPEQADGAAAAAEPEGGAPAVAPPPEAAPAEASPEREARPRDEDRDDDRREGRGRRGRRDDRDRRPAPPSEQAWGQPAGTPRRPGVPYALPSLEPREGAAAAPEPTPPPAAEPPAPAPAPITEPTSLLPPAPAEPGGEPVHAAPPAEQAPAAPEDKPTDG
jgi:hypothetical protein